jgi:glycosyltransferase involved in cell wall biosynthesis
VSAYAVVGPERHGVVAHAQRLALADDALRDAFVRIKSSDHATVARRLSEALDGERAAMLHVTDHLFGATPSAAADLIESLASVTPLALCLHDLPQPQEGEARHARRRACYARLARSATVVVVASEHERELLERCLDGEGSAVDVVVLPLPVERGDASGGPVAAASAVDQRRAPGRTPVVGVLGFLYPGKGLDDVIGAAAEVNSDHRRPSVVNIGAVAAGHDDLAEELNALAAARGVEFVVSGFVPEDDLATVLGEVDVPVAAHRHVSASGSVNAWIAAGRRPLVLAGTYTRELDRRMPGAVTLVETPQHLPAAIEAALGDPPSTWIGWGVTVGPTWSQSAADHAAVLRSIE